MKEYRIVGPFLGVVWYFDSGAFFADLKEHLRAGRAVSGQVRDVSDWREVFSAEQPHEATRGEVSR